MRQAYLFYKKLPFRSLTFIIAMIFFRHSYANGTEQIKKFCREDNTKRGALDDQMYNYCLKRQSEGITEIKTIKNEFKGKDWFETHSGPKCFKSWTKRDIPDYQMIAHCMRNEKEGYLDIKYQYEKKNKEIAIDCIINRMTSDTPMNSIAYCVKNHSPSDKSNADAIMTQIAQDNPNIKSLNNARGIIEDMYFGKQTKTIPSTMPLLPDVANLVPAQQPTSQRSTASSESNKGTGMMDKIKGWFSDSNSSQTSECPVEKTKNSFLSMCIATMAYNEMTHSGRQKSEDQIRDMCRCVALNFTVEKIPNPPDCSFSTHEEIYSIMRNDSVNLRCR